MIDRALRLDAPRCDNRSELQLKIFITGARGFLGSALVDLIARERPEYELTLFSRSAEIARSKRARIGRARYVNGDISDAATLRPLLNGIDAVIHLAAKVGVWGEYEEYHRVNYVGTENLINAALANRVGTFVHVSSPSVVFDGRAHRELDESAPYPDRYEAAYPATKGAAEKLLLRIDPNRLRRVILRPHLIWGPGDTNLIPRIIERARARKLAVIGDGSALVSLTYIDNAARACLDALEKLDSARLNGEVFFIADSEPVYLWEFIGELLKRLEEPAIERRIPYRAALAVGAMSEFVYKTFGIEREPRLTRFLARQLALDHSLSIEKARRMFGYDPAVGLEEGMRKTVDYFQKFYPPGA